jgi:hypothetical protein
MPIPGRIDSFDREPAGKHEFTVADVSGGSECGPEREMAGARSLVGSASGLPQTQANYRVRAGDPGHVSISDRIADKDPHE